MFNSLVGWLNNEFTVRSLSGTDAGGDPKYSEPITYKGYRVDDTEVIVDKYGKEYVSGTKIYVAKETVIKEDYLVSMSAPTGNTVEQEIHKLGGFYDGNTGLLDIQVLYL